MLYTKLTQACSDAAKLAASSPHKYIQSNVRRGHALASEFVYFSEECGNFATAFKANIQTIRRIALCKSAEEVVKTAAGVNQGLYDMLVDHRKRINNHAPATDQLPVQQPSSRESVRGSG